MGTPALLTRQACAGGGLSVGEAKLAGRVNTLESSGFEECRARASGTGTHLITPGSDPLKRVSMLG